MALKKGIVLLKTSKGKYMGHFRYFLRCQKNRMTLLQTLDLIVQSGGGGIDLVKGTKSTVVAKIRRDKRETRRITVGGAGKKSTQAGSWGGGISGSETTRAYLVRNDGI